MAVREWLKMQQPDLYRDGIFKLVQKGDKCIDLLGGVLVKNYDTSVE
jgi:hypothetical protein